MASNSSIKFTIAFNDPDLDSEDLDEQAQRLVSELKQMDEVDEVNRVIDPNPPEGNKSMGGFVVGLLTAEVSVTNAKKLLGFLGDRLGGKLIEFLPNPTTGNKTKFLLIVRNISVVQLNNLKLHSFNFVR
jgi:hypothetical protein